MFVLQNKSNYADFIIKNKINYGQNNNKYMYSGNALSRNVLIGMVHKLWSDAMKNPIIICLRF